jgi:hypothetical protein
MDRRLFLCGLAATAAAAPAWRRLSVFELALRPEMLERYRLAVRRVHGDGRWKAAMAKFRPAGRNALAVQRGMLYFYERMLNRAAPGEAIGVPYWPWEHLYAIPARRLPAIYGQGGGGELTREEVDVEPVMALRDADDFLAAAPGGAAATVEARMRLTPLEPAYWAHLANLDRLWVSWVALGEGRKPAEFRRERAGLIDENGLTRTVALQELRDVRALGYEYSTLVKPLFLSDGGFVLLRGVRVAAGRFGVFAEGRRLGSFTSQIAGETTLVFPRKAFGPGRPTLKAVPLDRDDRPTGNGGWLLVRETLFL